MSPTRVDAPEVWLADDAVTAHAGALSLGWGVSVTAGTGVACLAVPPDGEPRVIGGHGFLLGDEGGAFWIGREGLRAVLRAADGRGPATALAGPASQRFDGLDDLGARLHAAERPVDSIARFAPDVLAVAESGDAVASSIVEHAVDELVDARHVRDRRGRGRVSRCRSRSADACSRTDRCDDGSPMPSRVPSLRPTSARPTRPPWTARCFSGPESGPGRYAALVHVWDRNAR